MLCGKTKSSEMTAHCVLLRSFLGPQMFALGVAVPNVFPKRPLKANVNFESGRRKANIGSEQWDGMGEGNTQRRALKGERSKGEQQKA